MPDNTGPTAVTGGDMSDSSEWPAAESDPTGSTRASGGVAQSRRARRARTRQRALAEWIVAIGLAVLAALVIKTWLIQAYIIPSESMVPELQVGDRVLVSKIGFDLGDVRHGQILVFRNPKQLPGEPAHLIKRVIGLPGDELEARDGQLFRNGELLNEPYVNGLPTTNLPRSIVPEGSVFMMGDNRTNSEDSRKKGAVPEELLVGRAFFRLWPLGRLSRL
ncbi:MAG: signal peptidase I [Acidimicrobiia bacterium]|nr:signal peptidase I [Acidimicrobiia bacterium]